jgi:hypothetical protein
VRAIALVERVLGEPAAFMAPDEMCAFMAERGITGECEPLAPGSYRFVGTVMKPKDAA